MNAAQMILTLLAEQRTVSSPILFLDMICSSRLQIGQAQLNCKRCQGQTGLRNSAHLLQMAEIRIEVKDGATRRFAVEDVASTTWLLDQLGEGRLLFPEQSAKRGMEVADGSTLIAGCYKFFPKATGEPVN